MLSTVDGAWNTSSSFVSVPVRAEVIGPGRAGQIHHVYDFFNFMPSLPDDVTSVFEVPKVLIDFRCSVLMKGVIDYNHCGFFSFYKSNFYMFTYFTLDPKRSYLPWADKYRQTSRNSISVLLQSGNHQRNR